MDLPFAKMHGAGNDFVLLNARAGGLQPHAEQIQAMADRHTGIGFDQLLIVTPATLSDCRAAYRIFNADGSAAEQCGNGARCVAAWLHREGIVPLHELLHLESPAGRVAVELLAPLDVRVGMGVPDFSPAAAGFDHRDADGPPWSLQLGARQHVVQVLSLGNPHAVLEVDDVDADALAELGPALTHHPRFARNCNAGFVQVIDPHRLRLRVHERGAGWTRACGSGACAAAAAMIASGRCTSPVAVQLPGGTLTIDWPQADHTLSMRGPAAFVYEGRWPLS